MGFIKRNLARLQRFDFTLIGVNASYFVAQEGQAGSCGQSYVPRSNDRDIHMNLESNSHLNDFVAASASTNLKIMRHFVRGLALTLRYWMQTEVHVYAFSVAANVLLSFFPFLIVAISVSRIFFNQQITIGAIDLALRDFFPDSLRQFLLRNLPQRVSTQIISIFLLMFT